ncbi:hypothetical protein SEA_ONIONKNIGHT_54 [Streptomyces phage OnionKnight]|nr:hypothetical protein SEA_ONIONKNIGHT_54 [Streptomyces phage OnionKnight]
MTGPSVWLDNGDGWQELAGVTHIAIEEQHQPIDGWPDADAWLHGNGTGEMRGLLAAVHQAYAATPLELALIILRPHLARCPLYVG